METICGRTFWRYRSFRSWIGSGWTTNLTSQWPLTKCLAQIVNKVSSNTMTTQIRLHSCSIKMAFYRLLQTTQSRISWLRKQKRMSPCNEVVRLTQWPKRSLVSVTFRNMKRSGRNDLRKCVKSSSGQLPATVLRPTCWVSAIVTPTTSWSTQSKAISSTSISVTF